jgi:hypothetical protein
MSRPAERTISLNSTRAAYLVVGQISVAGPDACALLGVLTWACLWVRILGPNATQHFVVFDPSEIYAVFDPPAFDRREVYVLNKHLLLIPLAK